jgi:ATP-dependent DNA helicase RecG
MGSEKQLLVAAKRPDQVGAFDEERPRIEGNLPEVWQEALSVVGSLMRQPSRLVGNHFRPVSEYPRFSWQEALLNAIAHRDYSVQGAGIEVWLFDDRMEVTSPGGLLPELSLDELLSLRRVHCSRNPRLMRTLVDLGLTRDQGEGIEFRALLQAHRST